MSDPQFLPAGVLDASGHRRSRKMRCTDCPGDGYDTSGWPAGRGWMASHLRGHAPCTKCGQIVTLNRRGQPQAHSRCPSGPDPHLERWRAGWGLPPYWRPS